MALPQEFWEQLPQKTDAELCDIVARREDYLPEALAAAEDELNKRNVAPARIAELKTAIEAQQSKDAAKALEPLGWPLRILIFLFCAGLLGGLLAAYYENHGYKKKATDCWITLGTSLLCHLLLGGCLYLQRL